MNSKTLPVVLCSIFLIACTAAIAAPESKDAAAAMRVKVEKANLGSTLGEALSQLEKISGSTFEPDWLVLGSLGVGKDTKVTLEGADATCGQLLDALLQKAAPKGRTLAWYIENNKVQVTTQTRALSRLRTKEPAAEEEEPAPRPTKSARAPARRAVGGTTLNFDEVPLSDVVDFFRTVSGLNIHANWKALELSNVTKETTVTLQANNITLGRALTLVTEQLNAGKAREESVYWVVDDGVVMISTGAALNQKLVTKTFDVGDLLMFAPDFKGPRVNFEIASNNRGGNQGGYGNSNTNTSNSDEKMFPDEERQRDNKETDRIEHRRAVRDALISTIKDAIGEDMWQPNGKGSIKMLGSRMVVSQTLLGFKLLEDSAVLK